MTAKTSPQMSIETLVSLGTKRLAEILHEHAHDDPRLLEKLESILAEAPSVRVKPSGTMLGSIERRLAMLVEMDGYRDWRAAASVGADIDTIRQDIMESVLAEDPESAAGLLEQLVDLEHFLFETADDSDGEISGALRAVVDDWGRAWAHVADRDAETVAELVFDAFTDNEYGVLDEVIPAFEEALGIDGLAAGPFGAMQALGDFDYVDEVRPRRFVCGNEGVHVAAQVGDVLEAAKQHSPVPFAVPIFGIDQLGLFLEG